MMSAKIRIFLFLLCLAIMATSAIIAIQLGYQNRSEENLNHQDFTSVTLSSRSTLSAETTAIAIFTKHPTLALSSTPFYAEIIFNEVVRNLTEIPFPVRGYYLYPTSSVSAQDYAT